VILGQRGARPGHSVTTAHFQAAYPFLGQSGIRAPGVYMGTDAFGGAFAYDPWESYSRRLVRSPNMLFVGGIGYAKSAGIKTYLYRQRLFSRDIWVIDIKGEYGPLAKALGYTPIELRPGGEVCLNPLTRRGGRDTQLSLLRAVVQAALGRDLSPEEEAGLRVALDLVNEEAAESEPTLPMVVDVLLNPREAMVAGVYAANAEEFAASNRESALALQRLCEGDLRGMFDGPTSPGIDFEAPVVILDLSAVRDSAALGVITTCATAWQQALLRERKRESDRTGVPMQKTIVVVEEVWRVAGNLAVAEWLQANFKLCRSLGIQCLLSLHKLSDFSASGATGSRELKIIQGLVADCGCIALYQQSPDQRPVLRGDLALSEAQVELSMSLRLGEFLFVMGQMVELVQLRMSSLERDFTYTDEQMGVIAPVTAE
jgi:type IV secretory pathway VirB4 component